MKHLKYTTLDSIQTIFGKLLLALLILAGISLNIACHNTKYHALQHNNLIIKSPSITYLPEYEKIDFVYLEGDGITPRSKVTQVIEHQQGTNFYTIISNGEGNYDTYKDATWNMNNNFEIRDGFIYCINSNATIKDKATGNVLAKSEKKFDYEKNKIFCTLYDGKGAVSKSKVFPLKKPIVEAALLPYFLKPFVTQKYRDPNTTFYVLTEALNLYRMTLKFSKPEPIELVNGKTTAVKIRLIPSLGPLTSLNRLIAPDTYIWYSADEKCDWLKFEGLEADIGTTLIKGYAATCKLTPPPEPQIESTITAK